jgi:hypothetical protein
VKSVLPLAVWTSDTGRRRHGTWTPKAMTPARSFKQEGFPQNRRAKLTAANYRTQKDTKAERNGRRDVPVCPAPSESLRPLEDLEKSYSNKKSYDAEAQFHFATSGCRSKIVGASLSRRTPAARGAGRHDTPKWGPTCKKTTHRVRNYCTNGNDGQHGTGCCWRQLLTSLQ